MRGIIGSPVRAMPARWALDLLALECRRQDLRIICHVITPKIQQTFQPNPVMKKLETPRSESVLRFSSLRQENSSEKPLTKHQWKSEKTTIF